MIEDRLLTPHFTLYNMTRTDHTDLLEKNRDVSDSQIEKLTIVARLLEHVVFVLGAPIQITSGYRCHELNQAVGSTDTSQHRWCEAADFVTPSFDLGKAFRILWKDVKEHGTNVGQLIHETAQRDGKDYSWIHISVGTPWREEKNCGQILRMEHGKYTRLA